MKGIQKPGSHVSKLLFLLAAMLLFFGLRAGKAEEVRFTCSAPPSIGVGEQFRVTFSVNAQGADFRGPNFKGFSVLTGPNQSTSSNIQFINGGMTQTVSYTYTYILRADQEGSFEIGAASVNVGGGVVRSNPVTIQVVKSGANRSQGRQNQPSQQPATSSSGSNIGTDDLFVRTILSKSDVYQGEQIVVTQKIYSRVNLVGFEDVKYPSYSGFWASEVKMPAQITLQKETYNGVAYNVAELKKTILFPQKSGSITIEPITVMAVVQVRAQSRQRTGDPFFDNFFNDPFFGSSVQNVKKEVKSSPVKVSVKALPENGQPEGFSGAVGSYAIKATIDKQELKANEALSLKVTVAGNGNIELIDRLDVQFPSDFEVYDPKMSNQIAASAGGVSGSRTFEYTIIPRNPGTFQIPPVYLPYFDLAKRGYSRLETQGFTIKVGKGDGSSVTYSGTDKETIKYLGSDIRFIKTEMPVLQHIGYTFFNTWRFWLFFLLPPLLFVLVLIIWRRRVRMMADKSLMKNRKATRVAARRLKKAGEYLRKGQEEVFYVEISQALWGYLSDKLYIPPANLSMESARTAMSLHQVGEESIQQYLDTIQACEFARFAPGKKDEKMDNLYQQALRVIAASEKEIKMLS